jgi:hypothetical protein
MTIKYTSTQRYVIWILAAGLTVVFSISLFSSSMPSVVVNSYAQQNNTVAEDFKDCFIDFKSKNIFGVGTDLTNVIGLACYETYQAEGKFPNQMTNMEFQNIIKKLSDLSKQSDLDKILKAFGQ